MSLLNYIKRFVPEYLDIEYTPTSKSLEDVKSFDRTLKEVKVYPNISPVFSDLEIC